MYICFFIRVYARVSKDIVGIHDGNGKVFLRAAVCLLFRAWFLGVNDSYGHGWGFRFFIFLLHKSFYCHFSKVCETDSS